jgi:hypothetical protein
MASFPQTFSDLQTYISNLVNDPSNTRYTLTLINNGLDLAQHRWNNEAKICRITDYVLPVANTYRYQLSSSLTLQPIQILRVTWKGVPLIYRSKDYFDKYSSIDWTTTIGTPQEYAIDLNSNNTGLSQTGPSIIVHPVPQAGDVTLYTNAVGITNQNPLGVEYLCPHTQLAAAGDQPFTVNGTFINTNMIPYLAGLGLDVAASLLEPDPTAETVQKAKLFRAQANAYLSLVTQMYLGLEEDAPLRFGGGRTVRPSGIASSS